MRRFILDALQAGIGFLIFPWLMFAIWSMFAHVRRADQAHIELHVPVSWTMILGVLVFVILVGCLSPQVRLAVSTANLAKRLVMAIAIIVAVWLVYLIHLMFEHWLSVSTLALPFLGMPTAYACRLFPEGRPKQPRAN